MTGFWKPLLGLAVSLPLLVFVGTALWAAPDDPAPRQPIVIQDGTRFEEEPQESRPEDERKDRTAERKEQPAGRNEDLDGPLETTEDDSDDDPDDELTNAPSNAPTTRDTVEVVAPEPDTVDTREEKTRETADDREDGADTEDRGDGEREADDREQETNDRERGGDS